MTPIFIDIRSRTAAALAAGVLALGVLAAPVSAQVSLPDAVMNPPSGSVGAEERKQMADYVDRFKAGLSGADVDAITKSRRALLAPLRAREVLAGARVEYAGLLLALVRPLAADAKDEVAINATRVLGELATPEALTALAPVLKDKRPAVRLVAAMGYERTFSISSGLAQPIIVIRHVQTGLRDLDAALQAEADPKVADGLVIAYEAAINADPTKFAGIRAEAVKSLSGAINVKARDPKAMSFTQAIGRAADVLFNLVKDVNAVSATIVPDAVSVSGDVIALAVRTGCAGLTPEQQSDMAQMLIRAEKTYLFGRKKIENAQPADVNLSESFCADAKKFTRDAATVLSVLGKDGPFKLPDGRFPTK